MRATLLLLVGLSVGCARREEAKPSPEAKPSTAAEVEHPIEALTCRDGVLGVVAKPVSSESAQPAAPSTPPSGLGAIPSSMFAPIGDGGVGIGSIGTFGTGVGFGRAQGRAIVAMPVDSHGARAMAVSKGVCGHLEELRTCHDDAGRPLGTVILDLSIDAAGKATASKTSGDLDHEALRSCLSKALASVTFEPAAAGTTSYSIRFESAPAKAPRLGDAKPTATGDLDPAVIARVVRSRMAQIKYCYQKALELDPKTAGKIVVSFTIDPKGAVSGAKAASSTLGDASLDACIVAVFSKIMFPEPKSGSVTVSYPIVLSGT